jgi:hypothetical protein
LTTATIPESGKSNPKKVFDSRDSAIANLGDLFCAIAVFFSLQMADLYYLSVPSAFQNVGFGLKLLNESVQL